MGPRQSPGFGPGPGVQDRPLPLDLSVFAKPRELDATLDTLASPTDDVRHPDCVGAVMDIVVWLRSLGLGRYETAFRESEIDEAVLPDLTAEDLA
jgi:hypothetical protein